MALANEPAALMEKNAALKDAANRAGIRQGDEGRTVGSGGGVFVWK